ncbi:hypothetical protein [Streptomyces kronopolitis]|uniref:hypothetical protein n=1 Tax=Streptomyces kronopolitis TaxID=1612435 RepID=UPI003446A3E9
MMHGHSGTVARIWHSSRERPVADWWMTVVVVGLHFAWVRWAGSGDLLGRPDQEQRLSVYTTGATVVAIVGSFVTAAIAQYAQSSGPRMRALRTTGRLAAQFRRNWVSILSATIIIAGVCLTATVLDVRPKDTWGVHWMVEAALVLGACRAYRLHWLFVTVITYTDRDVQDERTPGGDGTPQGTGGTPGQGAPVR